ncbi:hypothetical protein E4U42_000263 [Claviceps africana]|uniref:Glucose-methanol-choline oxidoreductase N-terminal domain-containing protein n=1 Tax=Claviceps africana TaxID=83212 RepID=A0A8K0J0G2_9HYPO|nr:hypothetical protein E4U42_000263 [Claviceps africana]
MGSPEATRAEYDIIIAGGGTAACIVASRLAEADPGLSILLIEQGPNNLEDPAVTTPAMFWAHLRPESKYTTFYSGNKEESIDGRQTLVPVGRVLGGGSSINFMMYTRGQACDFDSWNTEGWDSKTLISLSQKAETFHLDGPEYDRSIHGYAGPIGISFGTYGPVGPRSDIIAAAVATGEKELADMQDFKTASGISPWFRYVSPDGKRQDVAHRYLHPLMASGKYPNLHLLVETTVSRVVFEGTRATGVECQPTTAPASSAPTPATVAPEPKPSSTFGARKLIVVSAGAFGTPQLLERSGIGNKHLLSQLDIPVVADLPGVGEEYQDHNVVEFTYKVDLAPSETLDALLSGREDVAALRDQQHPILGWNGVDVAAKLRPTEAEVAELGPDFQRVWDRDFRDRPDRPLMLLAVLSMSLGGPEEMLEAMGGQHHQYVTMGPYTAYPCSRGNVHIVSRDPEAAPSFRSGYLSHPADLKKLLWAYKKQREIMRRTNMLQAEVPLRHPKFPSGSKAALVDRHPVEGGAGYASLEERRALPPVEYDAEDDAAIEEYIRANIHTSWHSMGTCKMAPKDRGGVVDKDLNVHDVTNLKIADLSICPENVAANTYNTALVVGEKAAIIIGGELGLHIPG